MIARRVGYDPYLGNEPGYDPYNSADRSHILALIEAREKHTDLMIRRGLNVLARGGNYEMAPALTQDQLRKIADHFQSGKAVPLQGFGQENPSI